MRTPLFVLFAFTAVPATAGEPVVGVLGVDAHGLSATEVATLADSIATAAHELLPGRVLGPAEVRELLKEADAKPAKRCRSKRCWLRVGKAAGLTAVLAVRAVGTRRGVALSLKWVDVAGRRVAARHQQPIRKDVLTFAEDATDTLTRLTAKLEGKLPESVAPPSVAVAPAPAVEPAADPSPAAGAPPAAGGAGTVAASAPVAVLQPVDPGSTTTASPPARVWLGLGLGRGGAQPGAVVQRVTPGGPGAAARLKAGDIIQEWDGWIITTAKDVLGFALRTGADRSARIKVWRGGAARSLSITPVELADGSEADGYQITDLSGPPASTLPARPADSAPRGWPTAGTGQRR